MTNAGRNRNTKPHHSSRRTLLIVVVVWAMVLMAAAWWFVRPALTRSTLSASMREELPARTQSLMDLADITSSSIVPKVYQTVAKATAQHYMSAFLHGQFAAMWSQLAPTMQALWPNETSYTHFWQARFQGYTLQNFSIGTVRWLPLWVYPETMKDYHDVLAVPGSLALHPDAAISSDPSAPPEDVNPTSLYQNLLLVVQPVLDHAGYPARGLVLDGGPADPEAPILPSRYPAYVTVEVPIMMYHHVSDVIPTDVLGKSLTVKNTLFQQQLAYLRQQHYHTITFNQLFDTLYFGGPLPVHPIILTFDDGYKDVFAFAYPLLKEYGFTGTFNIITGRVGAPGYLSWNDIRGMLAGGMEIGSHTVHHYSMGPLVAYAPKEAQYEMQQSKATLQQELGITIQQFCYPSGSPFRGGTLAEQQEIEAMLSADGYIGATTDPGQTGVYQDSLRPFALLRIRVDGRATLQDFEYSLPW
jgi:peptidoglycan/xylan/chitin deacetylase (PgdA/CDA1 family)